MAADALAAACQSQPWGNGELVKADQFGEEPGHAGVLNFKKLNYNSQPYLAKAKKDSRSKNGD